MLSSKILIAFALLLINCISYAQISSSQTDQTVIALLDSVKTLPLEPCIVKLSEALLNKPYQSEPLGEGEQGQFNQEPLYRFDSFDCETYVNTVLALALTQSKLSKLDFSPSGSTLTDFQDKVRKIAYVDGKISFYTRTHFPDADWVPNNLKNNFIKEITAQVGGKSNIAIAQVLLNRKKWYESLGINRIKIANLSPAQRATKLQTLQLHAKQETNQLATIAYIPLEKFFPKQNFINSSLFRKIPNGAIVLFVEHNPDTVKAIGTAINISHMGFIIWRDGVPYLRAASSNKEKTIDLPLIDYLRYYLKDTTMKGIALFQVSDTTITS